MNRERLLAAQDSERSRDEDELLRAMNAISLDTVGTYFVLAEGSFPDDPAKVLSLAKWLCLNPDASPIAIMKETRRLRDAG